MVVRFLRQKKFSTRKHKIELRMHFVVAKRLCRPMIPALGRHGGSFSSLKQPEKLWGSLCLRGLFQSHFSKGRTPRHGEDYPFSINIPHCDAPLAAINGVEPSMAQIHHEL